MLEKRPHVLLVVFLLGLVAMNAWRLEAWGVDGIVRYLSDPVVQTTWFDFAAVLAILLVFIHRDARRHGLTWWWILPTFPFMPTIGLLAYFIVRRRALLARAKGTADVAPLDEVLAGAPRGTRGDAGPHSGA